MSFKQTFAEKTGISKEKMPSSCQIVGNIMLLKFMKIKTLKEKKKIARAALELYPRIKTVCEIKSIGGEFREPKITKLAGNDFVTTHKEHGILYKMDVSKVMFSKGNLFERNRIINQVNPDETIVDMFAGIGYFSLGLAKKAGKIYAIEKNPVAYKYLKENIVLNKIKNIEPILGDNRKIKLEGVADRIVMGYFPNTDRFLKYALRFAKKKCIIHYHNLYKEHDLCSGFKPRASVFAEAKHNLTPSANELWEKPLNELKALGTFKILNKKIVKSIAPRMYHVVVDVKVEKQ